MTDTPEQHLDLDALADVLAEQASDSDLSHLSHCPTCRAAVTELEVAMVGVTAALASLPEPELPADLAERLEAAVARERRALTGATATTVIPLASRSRSRAAWLPWAGGIAAAAVLVTGGVLLSGGGGNSGDSTNAATAEKSDAAGGPGLVRNATGTNYGRDGKALSAALPGLLASKDSLLRLGKSASPVAPVVPQQAPAQKDTLATLRSTQGLASCLSALSEPGVEGIPLAIDYAAYEGKPAMVVVLPSTRTGKVDVFVVGAGCRPADAQVLLFTRLNKPA